MRGKECPGVGVALLQFENVKSGEVAQYFVEFAILSLSGGA
jgi:hypothetical protein